VALRRLKAAAFRGQRGCHGWVQTHFFREPLATRQSEVTGSGIARVVKGYKELASVTDDIIGDQVLFVRAHAF
jgi:hypothetical protein